jgi:hypothetical protein
MIIKEIAKRSVDNSTTPKSVVGVLPGREMSQPTKEVGWDWPGSPPAPGCSRGDYLANRAVSIHERDEMAQCARRRQEPGYARIMDVKYGG